MFFVHVFNFQKGITDKERNKLEGLLSALFQNKFHNYNFCVFNTSINLTQTIN